VECPQAESQAIIKAVYRAVHLDSDTAVLNWIPLNADFMGNRFSYDVSTKEFAFAESLAAVFSNHVGYTLQQLGDLNIDF